MTDDFRKLIETKRESAAQHTEAVEADTEPEQVDHRCYSLVSSSRMQKLMLELRFKNGNAKAIAYSYLLSVNFDPSHGIVLDFGTLTVKVQGFNLIPVFQGLVAQRIAWIRELESEYENETMSKTEPQVTAITVTER
jgi:hypothetical protein